jgi:hypothetical protein
MVGKISNSELDQDSTPRGGLHLCQCEINFHLGFTGLVQIWDGLFQLFLGEEVRSCSTMPIKYKGSRAVRLFRSKRNLLYTRLDCDKAIE